ncbi:hypothetical protein QWY31_00895 [Cytophagales bacterium LB-30]|uniref:Transposase n=1 Tax=Shiella aurantiaca TaxID=3058365 RepID=A0ABT8F1C2_9BACT|nr:hypothetical protein [Shiella aurantiaca]
MESRKSGKSKDLAAFFVLEEGDSLKRNGIISLFQTLFIEKGITYSKGSPLM